MLALREARRERYEFRLAEIVLYPGRKAGMQAVMIPIQTSHDLQYQLSMLDQVGSDVTFASS